MVCLGFQVPCRTVHMGLSVCVGGVGLLFEIWIVDASIFVVCCRQRGRAVPVCAWAPFLWGGGGDGCGVVLVVASCEGHTVDALASRADEGRRSLR